MTLTMYLDKIRRDETMRAFTEDATGPTDTDEHSPAEFEKHLSRLTDERLLQECAKFPKAILTAFETAALIDELCDRLRKQLDLD